MSPSSTSRPMDLPKDTISSTTGVEDQMSENLFWICGQAIVSLCRNQRFPCNTLPVHIDDFEVIYNVVVLLPKLMKGYICIFGRFKAPMKQVLCVLFLKIRNHLLVHGVA